MIADTWITFVPRNCEAAQKDCKNDRYVVKQSCCLIRKSFPNIFFEPHVGGTRYRHSSWGISGTLDTIVQARYEVNYTQPTHGILRGRTQPVPPSNI